MRPVLAERKYLILLVVAVLAEVLQPLATGFWRGLIFYDVLVALVLVVVLAVVLEGPRQRLIGFALALPAVLGDWLHYVVPDRFLRLTEIIHHCFTCAFLTFAVVAILTSLFGRKKLHGDEVLGSLCGYLLAGGAFANLFVLTELLAPGSYAIQQGIAWRLGDWHTRRFLFGYFSFVSLTSMGYGDITPVGAVAAALTWMEAVFGQFYLAVVVAQLVGLWLPRRDARENP